VSEILNGKAKKGKKLKIEIKENINAEIEINIEEKIINDWEKFNV
jgi:hypothetical protein